MAFLYGGSSGGVLVSSVVADEVYDPVYDTPLGAQFVYQVLPDFYRVLMDDQDLFELVWQGAMQGLSADLLHLWQVDYAKSLNDVPVISQRKWQEFDLLRVEAFDGEPVFDLHAEPSLFVFDDDLDLVRCEWETRARTAGALFNLLGNVDQDTSLEWSVEIELESADPKGIALFGYFGDEGHQLTAAIVGDETQADLPVAALFHTKSATLTAALSSVPLEMDTAYRLDCTYTARTGTAVLSVTDLRAPRFSGTNGETPGDPGDTITNQFSDYSVNFDDEGVVAGDVLIVLGAEYVISSVNGSILVVETFGLPVDLDNLSYEIEGEELVTSISLDLPGEAADPTFSCGLFGTAAFHTSVGSNLGILFSVPGDVRRKKVTGTTTNWTFLDPTGGERIVSLPRMQDVVTDPALLLHEGTDYYLDYGTDPTTTTVKFQEPPRQSLWAEYVGYDEHYIRDNFGTNVGLEDFSSEQYKAKVRGLYFAYFEGPTVEAIRRGVHILVGLPIAEEAGTVEAINLAYSGTLGLIRVADIDYLFPLAVGTDLQVGDEVELFQPLSRGVEVVDYLLEPEWFTVFNGVKEIQKFHSFLVRLNLDAFAVETLALASIFVEAIKPTWKQALFTVFKSLEDDLTPQDEITLNVVLNLYDIPCDTVLVSYDDNIYEGEEEDWRYDQGVTTPPGGWGSTSAGMRGTSTALTGLIDLTNASSTVNGTGTVFETELGIGILSDTYIAVGLYTTAADGESFAGSPLFQAAAAFDRVVIGDHVVITGEGTLEVTDIRQTGTITVPAGGGASLVDTETFTVSDLVGSSVVFEFDLDGSPPVTPGNTAVPYFAADTQQDVVDSIIAAIESTSLGVLVTDLGGGTVEVLRVGGYLTMSELVSHAQFTVSVADPYLDLDASLANTASGVSWEVRGALSLWGEVQEIINDGEANLVQVWPGVTDTYHYALINNDAWQLFYDRYLEDCPNEWLTFEPTISVGYEENSLSGNHRRASDFWFQQTGGNYITEVGPAGPVTDKYVVMRNGCWIQITDVITSATMSTGAVVIPTEGGLDNTYQWPLFLANDVLPGTLNFTNGSAVVPTSTDLSLHVPAVVANDYLQVVPTPDLTDHTTAPVVQVLSVSPTQITLTAPYTGNTALATKAIRRGSGSILPKAVTLPISQTGTAIYSFTDFYGTPGGTVSSTISEPIP